MSNNPNNMIVQSAPTNGLGTAGFIVSLIGLVLTGGVLCPIGLILSLVALGRPPRGMAIAGTILGLLGTMVPVLLFVFFGVALFSMCSCLSLGVSVAGKEMATESSMRQAEQRVVEYYGANGRLPTDAEGDGVIGGLRDGYGNKLRYQQVSPREFEIRSAGADGRTGTSDDRFIRRDITEPTTAPVMPGGPSRPMVRPSRPRPPPVER